MGEAPLLREAQKRLGARGAPRGFPAKGGKSGFAGRLFLPLDGIVTNFFHQVLATFHKYVEIILTKAQKYCIVLNVKYI